MDGITWSLSISRNQRQLHRSQRGTRYSAWLLFSHVKGNRDEILINKHSFHLDNLPIHSATCYCYEYDGVLLLMIITTVMVIINNYLDNDVMLFYLVGFKCLLFLDN